MVDYFLSFFFTPPTDAARLEVLKGFFILVSALLTAVVTVLIFQLNQRANQKKQFAEASHLRQQRQEDLLYSLKAEIAAGEKVSAKQLTPEERKHAISLMSDRPFATADRTNFVFESIKHDLAVLPFDVLPSVVKYYKLAERSNLLTDRLSSPDYRDLEPERQRDFVEDLMDVIDEQKKAASEALAVIEKAIEPTLLKKQR